MVAIDYRSKFTKVQPDVKDLPLRAKPRRNANVTSLGYTVVSSLHTTDCSQMKRHNCTKKSAEDKLDEHDYLIILAPRC